MAKDTPEPKSPEQLVRAMFKDADKKLSDKLANKLKK